MRWSLSRTRPATDGPAAPSPLDDRDPGTEAEYDVDADVPRPRRRPTRLLVAGIVVVVGAMALWSQFGARRAELPPLPAASAAASLLAPGTSTLGAAADPAVSGGAAAPASEAASGGATDLPARPTFYRPLTSRAADTTDGMPSQGAAFSDLAREEHEAQLATIK